MAKIPYVGYYYNAQINDMVFILPKVFISENNLAFDRYRPEEIIDLSPKNNPLKKNSDDEVVFELSVWLYQAIMDYKRFINKKIIPMNIETLRNYCLSLPQVTEYFPFDETTLAFRVGEKIFAMLDLEDTEWFVLKCNPDYAVLLRDRYPEIAPAWHMNKKYWNQLNVFGALSDSLITTLIRHSYNEVIAKMSQRKRAELMVASLECDIEGYL